MRIKEIFIFSVFGIMAFASAAVAQVQSVTLYVDGLACPFCAYGVEKKLKRVEGVGSMDIRMSEGIIALSAADGKSIDVVQVPRAVRDSGFSLRRMRVEATGTVKRVDGGLYLQHAPEKEFFFIELSSALRGELDGFSESGEPVSVEGLLLERPEGPWSLKPGSVEGVAR